MAEKRPFIYNPPQTPLTFLYEDEAICLIDKPAGLLSVPGRGENHDDCLMQRLEDINPNMLLIHRLDCATSGVMIFAKDKLSQKKLGRQFEKRATQKTYIAEIYGHPSTEQGRIEAAMRCDWENRPIQIIDPIDGRNAITDWQIIEKRTETSLVALKPETGRSHQLRVHMAHLGHPILGDAFYANDKIYEMTDRLHLHAQSLSFYHPVTNDWMTIETIHPFTS